MTGASQAVRTAVPGPAARRPLYGVALALGAVLLWGSNAVIARHLAMQGVSMSAVAFLRVAIGGAALLMWLPFSGSTAARAREAGGMVRDRWIWLATACYGGNMLVFHWALARTSASAVMMLENIAPLVALLGGAWLFGETVTRRALLALALAMAGVILVCLPAASREPASAWTLSGNALALLAGLTWGGYTLACRGHARCDRAGTGGASGMLVVLLGSAVMLAPSVAVATGWPSRPAQWAWVLALGLLHTALATVLWRLALTHIRAYTASLLFLLTILLTIVNSSLFLGEHATPLMLLGAAFIIAALVSERRGPGGKR